MNVPGASTLARCERNIARHYCERVEKDLARACAAREAGDWLECSLYLKSARTWNRFAIEWQRKALEAEYSPVARLE